MWASGRWLPCCGWCCGHGLVRQIRHVAGVLSRCGSSSRCFRSWLRSWLRSLPLSGLLVPIMFVWSPECWPGSVLPRCVLRGAAAGVRSCSALLSSGALTRAIALGNSRFVFAGTCTCKAFVPEKKNKQKKTCLTRPWPQHQPQQGKQRPDAHTGGRNPSKHIGKEQNRANTGDPTNMTMRTKGLTTTTTLATTM